MFSVIFEDNFLLLPSKHQEIWKVLWWWCNKFRNAFPSHETIAEKANCSRRTVISALSIFKNFGWLSYLKRNRRSNIYYIHKELLKKDPKNQKLYQNIEGGGEGSFRESCTESCTLPYVAKNSVATVRSDVQHFRAPFSNKQQPRAQLVNPLLCDLPFSREDKLIIQRNFNERIIGIALSSYKTYRYTPRNPISLFLWLCKDAKKYINSIINKV